MGVAECFSNRIFVVGSVEYNGRDATECSRHGPVKVILEEGPT